MRFRKVFSPMKMTRNILAVLVILMVATHASLAVGSATPEIDPAMGTGVLAFLGGAILVIRGRGKA